MRAALCLLVLFLDLCALPVRAQDNDALAALVELLAQADDPQFQLDLLKGMSEGLKGQREVKAPAGWDELAPKLEQSSNPEVRSLAQSLSLTFGSDRALASMRARLADPAADLAGRRQALESLLAVKDALLPPLLRSLLREPELRASALRGLAGFDDPETPGAILAAYPGLNVAEKRDALNTLVSRVAFARPLLDAVGEEKVPRRDLTADIVRQLRAFKDDQIQARVAEVWGVTRESPEEKREQIAARKAALAQGPAGDMSSGRAVYARVCQQCHMLFGVGGRVGPDITGANRGDLDYLLENIFDPNAVIPIDYQSSTVETRDDRVLTGIVTQQDANAITIVTANEEVIVPRREILSIQQGTISMMPEGLVDPLSAAEFRDLIAYLQSPAQVPMLASADNLDSFFNGQDLTGWEGDTNLWSVVDGEIVGKTPGLNRNEWLSGPLLLSDFKFTVEVKLIPNAANSGIQFRSVRLPNGEVKGYQADIGAGWWGKLYEEHGRGLLWEKSGEVHLKPEQWNRYEILAHGARVRTYLNGQLCVDLNDPMGARQGIIAFQLHSGGRTEVHFKNMTLELLPDQGTSP